MSETDGRGRPPQRDGPADYEWLYQRGTRPGRARPGAPDDATQAIPQAPGSAGAVPGPARPAADVRGHRAPDDPTRPVPRPGSGPNDRTQPVPRPGARPGTGYRPAAGAGDATRAIPRPGTGYGPTPGGGYGPSAGTPAGQWPPPGAPGGPGGPRPAGPPPAPPGARPRRRHPVRRVLLALLALVVAYLVFLAVVPAVAWSNLHRVDAAPAGNRPAATSAATNFLVVGSDSRSAMTAAQRKKLGTGNAAGARTDTIMLLSVPAHGEPVLVSIPRDSYVPIPGHGRNKINAAFAFGGPKLLAATIENTTGLRVDEYVEVGFDGFVDVVDSLGGIEMCLPTPIKDHDAHIDLPKGCQNLSGKNALGYVRARHFDPQGDLGRVKRQRAFLGAVVHKTASPGTILNPVRYANTMLAVGNSLTVSTSFGPMDGWHFVSAMRAISAGRGVTLTVPVATAALQTPAGVAVQWDRSAALELFHALRAGQPVPKSARG